VYPPDAKKAGIEGTVRVKVVIETDGSVQPLGVESGHPLLAPAAIEAVRQWKYRPTMVQGEPVEVTTVVDVTFALDDKR
jgi:protein TonB